VRVDSPAGFVKAAQSHSVCLVIANPEERARLLAPCMKSYTEQISGQAPIEEILGALQAATLFSAGRISVWIDDADKLSKQHVEQIIPYLARTETHILLGANGKTPLTKHVEKVGLIFDLSDEKPWDKEKRLGFTIQQYIRDAYKSIEPDLVGLLIGSSFAEIDKLIAYVGDRSHIDRSDIAAIINPPKREETMWKIAENIVWEAKHETIEEGLLMLFLAAMQSVLTTGLKLALLIEENVPRDTWETYLPKMWPKTIDKRALQARQFGPGYFRKGLDTILEANRLVKLVSVKERALVDLVQLKIYPS
jgi:DNA polymerase-3 subunit delta